MIAIDLKDKSILVTGGLGAIARVTVARLIEAGAFVFVTDILGEAEGQQALEREKLNPGRCEYRTMDVTSSKDVTGIVRSIFEKHPKIDVAIGLAGGCGLHPFATSSEETFAEILRVNFMGQTYFTRAVLQEWTQRGRPAHMIYASSWVGSNPWPDISAYVSAKAALDAFAKCMALEYAKYGIRFNAIAPGHVAAGSSLKVYQTNQQYREQVDRVIPLKRLVGVGAVADAFVWLASDLASDINGQIIRVDLGASIPKLA